MKDKLIWSASGVLGLKLVLPGLGLGPLAGNEEFSGPEVLCVGKIALP